MSMHPRNAASWSGVLPSADAVAKIFIGDVTVSLQKGHICCRTLVVTSKGFFVL